MPINADTLSEIASAYVAPMTSIRGRRVHRFIMRELRRFDHVFTVSAVDGRNALLAVGDDGQIAHCQTDGRGPAVCINEWAGPEAPQVTTCYDLKRDSLPILTHTVGNATFPDIARTITLSPKDLRRVSENPLHRFVSGSIAR
jgi:hypothetical protein